VEKPREPGKRPAGVELDNDGPLSMYPLDVGKALEAALKVPPPPKAKRPGKKKKEEQPPK
jgi:hypothetical protein